MLPLSSFAFFPYLTLELGLWVVLEVALEFVLAWVTVELTFAVPDSLVEVRSG